MDKLEKFQNLDGGFDRGIEPDFKLGESSPDRRYKKVMDVDVIKKK
ncbi:hypothetical protein RBU61_12665 [Tissierella sp. MB52-C2]|nr:hypothetical protein [Tissierella sp. MB52-C2]WMM23774.1 hypothetical protein RBU61_12665 [Tissierella sp. MB52-C2]